MKSVFRFLILLFSVTILLAGNSLFAQNIEGYETMLKELVQDEVPLIEISEIDKYTDEKIYLLDTREKGEFKTSHIPNAIHVGYLFFSAKSIKDIPKDAVIITYCSVGYRSGKVGERLMRKGYKNVFNLSGGIFSWANNKKELVSSEGIKTTKVHGYNQDWSKWLNSENCEIVVD